MLLSIGVDCGFWGHENAPSCSHCGTGPKECGGECFWKENAQACIPLTSKKTGFFENLPDCIISFRCDSISRFGV